MKTQIVSITGQVYGHQIKTGRGKSADPKRNICIRLHETTIRAIEAGGMSKQRFIEQAVYEKLYGFRNTETL